jgi:hypothetical protein
MDSAAAVRLQTLHEVAALRRQEAEQASADTLRRGAPHDAASASASAPGQPWPANLLVPSVASGSLALLGLALLSLLLRK